jgi:hypothetical protein
MKTMMNHALRDNGDQFGDYLLDHENIDFNVSKTFLDINMPNICNSRYVLSVRYIKLSEVITNAKIAFA